MAALAALLAPAASLAAPLLSSARIRVAIAFSARARGLSTSPRGDAPPVPDASSPPPAAPPASIDAAAAARVRRGADAISSLAANPYGWPQSARAAREAPLWMLLEAEREEAPLASALARKVVAPRDLRSIVLDAPALDARGRAYATGRRKTSVARVWVAAGDGAFTVNGRSLASHFERLTLRQAAILPLVTTQSAGAFDVSATVRGGGLSGQAGAVKLGVARALARFDPFLKPVLRRFGQIQRDPRAVERKKPGRPKARKRCVARERSSWAPPLTLLCSPCAPRTPAPNAQLPVGQAVETQC